MQRKNKRVITIKVIKPQLDSMYPDRIQEGVSADGRNVSEYIPFVYREIPRERSRMKKKQQQTRQE